MAYQWFKSDLNIVIGTAFKFPGFLARGVLNQDVIVYNSLLVNHLKFWELPSSSAF